MTHETHPIGTGELLPCPFCGGDVEIVPDLGDTSDWIRHKTRPRECALEFSAFYLDTDLATVWNHRATLRKDEDERA